MLGKRVLVVEDSPTQAMRARLILEREGFDVDLAGNGVQGLDKVKAAPPDMVVTDLVMPEMDGYELCKAIKTDRRLKDLPVVMLTSQDKALDVIKGLGVGADNFITKPYESDYLVGRVETIFKNIELRQQGLLPEDLELSNLRDKIVLTTDRQQIIELVLSTVGVMMPCNVLGLLLLGESDRENQLYMVSVQPLSGAAEQDLEAKIFGAVAVICDRECNASDTRLRPVVKELGVEPMSGPFESFISVPLIDQGEVIGILTAASGEDDCFDAEDVKSLYSIGAQSVEAFAKVSR